MTADAAGNSLTYDKDGNLSTKTDASGNVWTFTFDYRNRLSEVVEKNSGGATILTENLTYDVNNNLIGTAVNGVYQRWTVSTAITRIYMDLSGSGTLTDRYLESPTARDVYFAAVAASGAISWLFTDNLGSVREVVGPTGTVLDQITYGAFGNILSQTNSANAPRFLYGGGEWDANLGTYRFEARWYDPVDGRWASQDPLGLGPDTDPYRYCANAPVFLRDPDGQDFWDWIANDVIGTDNVLGWNSALGNRRTGWFAGVCTFSAGYANGFTFGLSGNFDHDFADHNSGWYTAGTFAGTIHRSLIIRGLASFMDESQPEAPCLPAGTPIRTPEGSKMVEELRPGDSVLSRYEWGPNGPVEAKPVEEIFARVSPVLRLRVAGHDIRVTPEHAFYVEGRGWISAAFLEVGDRLHTLQCVKAPVEEVSETGEVVTVYNFRVADFHTYFVGTPEWRVSVWTHNTNNGPATPSEAPTGGGAVGPGSSMGPSDTRGFGPGITGPFNPHGGVTWVDPSGQSHDFVPPGEWESVWGQPPETYPWDPGSWTWPDLP